MQLDPAPHRARGALLALVVLLCAACSPPGNTATVVLERLPPASAWPAASGDAARTSPARATGPRTGRVAWSRELEGAVVPGPVIAQDGSVLAASNGGVLHALDPRTGADRWIFDGGGSYGVDTSTSPAVLDDGTILWPGPGPALYGLSPAGRLLWTVPREGQVLSPAVVGRTAYVADASGALVAYDLPRGSEPRRRWTLEIGSPSYSSPAVGADGTVYAASGMRLVAVADRGTSARIRWSFRTPSLIEVSPAVGADDTVVIGSNDRDEYGLGPDGQVRWRYDRGDWTYSSAVVRDGLAYFGDHLGHVDVVDARTGQERHRLLGIPKEQGTSSAGTGIWTAPLVDAGGNVYAGSAAGHVYGFAADGTRLWDADVGGIVASYPALTADGTLLIGSTTGVLHAFADG